MDPLVKSNELKIEEIDEGKENEQASLDSI
jgi:hypothetical protein